MDGTQYVLSALTDCLPPTLEGAAQLLASGDLSCFYIVYNRLSSLNSRMGGRITPVDPCLPGYRHAKPIPCQTCWHPLAAESHRRFNSSHIAAAFTRGECSATSNIPLLLKVYMPIIMSGSPIQTFHPRVGSMQISQTVQGSS